MTQAEPQIKVEDGDELANQAEIATETPGQLLTQGLNRSFHR
jgi:hypothetical protein